MWREGWTMDLRSIRYFVRIADPGSIRLAAAPLSVAKSALSWQVRLLESEIGTPLLARQLRSPPAQFVATMKSEIARLGIVIKEAGVREE